MDAGYGFFFYSFWNCSKVPSNAIFLRFLSDGVGLDFSLSRNRVLPAFLYGLQKG